MRNGPKAGECLHFGCGPPYHAPAQLTNARHPPEGCLRPWGLGHIKNPCPLSPGSLLYSSLGQSRTIWPGDLAATKKKSKGCREKKLAPRENTLPEEKTNRKTGTPGASRIPTMVSCDTPRALRPHCPYHFKNSVRISVHIHVDRNMDIVYFQAGLFFLAGYFHIPRQKNHTYSYIRSEEGDLGGAFARRHGSLCRPPYRPS